MNLYWAIGIAIAGFAWGRFWYNQGFMEGYKSAQARMSWAIDRANKLIAEHRESNVTSITKNTDW